MSGSSTTTTASIPAVVAAARESDVVLVFAGEPSSLSGEAASRSDLRLPGRQEELIRQVAATGTPFAVVLENGRPLVVADWIDAAPAVVEAWHGGTEAAAAIVDVLLGDAEPAGRLPMSFPRSVGQVPIHYAHERTGRPASVGGSLTESAVDVGPARPRQRAREVHVEVPRPRPRAAVRVRARLGLRRLRARRHELSHDEVALDALERGETVTIELDVTNTSDRRGDEVIQAYLEDVVASVAPPVRRLVAFERRTIEPGSTVTVSFELGTGELGFWATDAADARFIVEPGLFRLHVGSTLERTQAVEFLVR